MLREVEVENAPSIMAADEEDVEQVEGEDWYGEDALIARPALQVAVHLLPPGGAEFLRALAGGRPLGEAAQEALDARQEFNLTDSVAGLIGYGLVSRIKS